MNYDTSIDGSDADMSQSTPPERTAQQRLKLSELLQLPFGNPRWRKAVGDLVESLIGHSKGTETSQQLEELRGWLATTGWVPSVPSGPALQAMADFARRMTMDDVQKVEDLNWYTALQLSRMSPTLRTYYANVVRRDGLSGRQLRDLLASDRSAAAVSELLRHFNGPVGDFLAFLTDSSEQAAELAQRLDMLSLRQVEGFADDLMNLDNLMGDLETELLRTTSVVGEALEKVRQQMLGLPSPTHQAENQIPHGEHDVAPPVSNAP